MPEAHPIAFTALQPGTAVQTSDGYDCGAAQAVLVDEKVSVFDGFVVQTTQGTRFVDADQSGSIQTTYVGMALSANQAAELPLPMVDNDRHQPGGADGRPVGPRVRSAQAAVPTGYQPAVIRTRL